ncbi:SLC13 family permease [Egicoccus sp. AB-alg6-2]|uniref:SLC13 family permease n=1 Tax=Egicoccus sp. AB-alg6-2 TaxID=3242692 RepID=UPI00359DA45D
MIGLEGWLAAAILLVLVLALVREVVAPAAAMVGALVACVLVGILPAEQAFLGLANPATISIAGLFVVARAVRDHAGIDGVIGRFLGDGSGGAHGALLRFVPPVIGLSGFLNNTPLVAAGAPVIRGWAERNGVAATKLLMPLSFAAILGGTLTVIGTGPNLVISGMLQAAGEPGLRFFELTPAGLPLAVVGGTALVVLAPRLLPDRRTPHELLAAHERDYTLRLQVLPSGPVDGRTVAQAHLRDLPGTFLAAVRRHPDGQRPAAPDTVLHGGDELVFVGNIAAVRDLLTRPGLVEAERAQIEVLDGDGHGLTECVVGSTSALVGSTLKEVSFRGRYGGAVIALHRASERVDGKLGTVELRAGDALLLLGDPGFAERWNGHRDFALLVPHDDRADGMSSPRYRWLTLATFSAMVVLAATGALPVLSAILLACTVLVATRAIRFTRAIDALDLDVLLIVAAAIGLGQAIAASGLSEALAAAIEGAAVTTSPMVALALVAIGTMVLTELLTNVAAAALMLPIALDVAQRVGAEPTGFAVAVALAASSSYLTPIGYQTNTIVYGLGGYRFGDYWRLGLPMAVISLATILVAVPLVWR